MRYTRSPGMSSADQRRLAPWLVALAGYAAITLAITWPLATHLSSALTHDAGDPALATWILWWNAHNLPLTTPWWNAPAFWPARGVLSFSGHVAPGVVRQLFSADSGDLVVPLPPEPPAASQP